MVVVLCVVVDCAAKVKGRPTRPRAMKDFMSRV